MNKFHFKKLILMLVLSGFIATSVQGFGGVVSKAKYHERKEEIRDLKKELEELRSQLVERDKVIDEVTTTNSELQTANKTLQEEKSVLETTLNEMSATEVEIAGNETVIDEVPYVGEGAMVVEGVEVGVAGVTEGVNVAVESVGDGIEEVAVTADGSSSVLKTTGKTIGTFAGGYLVNVVYEYLDSLRDKYTPDEKENLQNTAGKLQSSGNEGMSQQEFDSDGCVLKKITDSVKAPMNGLNKDLKPITKLQSPLNSIKSDMDKIREDLHKVEKPVQDFLNKLNVFKGLTSDLKHALTKEVSWKFTYPSPTLKDPKRKKHVYIHVGVKDALKGGKHLEKTVKYKLDRISKVIFKELKKSGLKKFEKEIKKDAKKVVSAIVSDIKSHKGEMKKLSDKILDMPELKRVKSFAKNNAVSKLLKESKKIKSINMEKYNALLRFDLEKIKNQCNAK